MAHPDRCPTSVHDVGVTKAPIRPSPGSNSPGRLPRSAVGAGDTRPGAQPSNARRGTRHSKVDPKDSRRSDQRDRRRAVTGPKVKIAVCVCRLCGRAELASSGVQRRTCARDPGPEGSGWAMCPRAVFYPDSGSRRHPRMGRPLVSPESREE